MERERVSSLNLSGLFASINGDILKRTGGVRHVRDKECVCLTNVWLFLGRRGRHLAYGCDPKAPSLHSEGYLRGG